ncbi:methyl-accepting chemotaxis protein [Clostridium tagluense]|uniref:methyl-accepting chemotaxis protein n=1 Tax=Clostridium tagluense TaxID=360422 RepID=UPI001C0E7491|nr:methyl-accepting chemotaxis protein [Clostridium tagluense]MBU3128237.1 methyl-accepting chemotaxis protein [Clostridium tagluense]MCB2314091.1 methyl-accepting chemotaxis protein [Clostridium tagluense]MCB2318928.1 methyl-accepting chemotaxis protein [Clostridium tagluense]MCB2323827.1 methyl-accepting chemotaxis protein [Clostridium tagluense]MCB2328649.1 methyl-accepting chemotaxis protein [Clostridium tagluense]
MKLRGKFISMFIAFALIPVLIAGATIMIITKNSSMKEARSSLQQQEKSAMTSINESISLIIKSGQDMSNNPSINSYLNILQTGKKDLQLKNQIANGFKSTMKTYGIYDNILLLDKNGTIIISALGTTDGKSLSSREYYVRMKETKKTQISKVLKSSSSGNNIVVISVPILDANNEVRASILTSVALSGVAKIINGIKIGDTGSIYIIESDGTAVAHIDEKEILQKNILKLDIGKEILENKQGIGQYTYKGVNKLLAYDTNKELGWTFVANIPVKELTKTASLVFMVLVGIILLTIIIAAAIAIIIAKGISKPIEKVSGAMSKIAEGDFTITVNEKGKDEIAQMSGKLNKTLVSLKESIKGVKDTSNEVGTSAVTLSSTSRQMTNVANEVASAIQEVAKGASEQASEISDVVSLLNDFTRQLTLVEDKLINVNNKANDTQVRAINGKGQIDSLVNSIKQIKASFEVVVNKVTGLSGTVSKIGNITDVINEVSEQTNLLALNAAIEAARAGEQGRGFAVVADEIRKLAEESKNSSEEILNLVKSISKETDDVIDTTASVNELITKQEGLASETIISFENIINSVVEIGPLMEETNVSLKRVDDSKTAVINKIENISAVAQEVSASSEQIAASSEEMLSSCEEVAEFATKVDEASQNLKNKVGIFKIE